MVLAKTALPKFESRHVELTLSAIVEKKNERMAQTQVTSYPSAELHGPKMCE